MKRFFPILLAANLLLAPCSKQESKRLTRIDVQRETQEDVHITDDNEIESLIRIYEEVEWNPNMKAEMARKEDVLATFFYTFDKNMSERLYNYRIWFNTNESATIISSHKEEGFGKLDKENAGNLKKLLSK